MADFPYLTTIPEKDNERIENWIRKARVEKPRISINHILLALVRIEDERESTWSELKESLGLSNIDLKNPDLPEELRRLLTLDKFSPYMFLWIGGSVSFLLLAFLFFYGYGFGVLFASWYIFTTLTLLLVIKLEKILEKELPQRLGKPLKISLNYKKQMLLQSLAENPFVLQVGEYVIENIPAISQLDIWLIEIELQQETLQKRLFDLEELKINMEKVLAKLNETDSSQLRKIKQTISAEKILLQKLELLQTKITTERLKFRENLDEIQNRAILEGLRRKSEEILGEQSANPIIKIDVHLEVDIEDIRREFQEINETIKQEHLKSRAITEVGGL